MTRKIPIISLEDFETKSKKPLIMKTLVANITEGVEDDLESVNIAEIKQMPIEEFNKIFIVVEINKTKNETH